MARPQEFSDTTKRQAFDRQRGKCGICGQQLTYGHTNTYQAHHIVSAAYSQRTDLADLDNCVVLCMQRKDGGDGCHIFAHGDSYRRLFELERKAYKFFKG